MFKYFSLTLILVAVLASSCSKDSKSWADKYQGSWALSFTGDVTGNLNLTVGPNAGETESTGGSWAVTQDGITSNYVLTSSTISESGALSINLLSQYDESGTISGQLGSDDKGSGTYNLEWIDENGISALRGDWTASHN